MWDRILPASQQRIIDHDIAVHTVDAAAVAGEVGLGGRVNTVLQTCFFALTGVLPVDQAIAAIKEAIAKAYGKLGTWSSSGTTPPLTPPCQASSRSTVPASVPSTEAGSGRRRPPTAPDFVNGSPE